MTKKIKNKEELEQELNRVVAENLHGSIEFNKIVFDFVNDLKINEPLYQKDKKAYEDTINNHYEKLQKYLKSIGATEEKRPYHAIFNNYKKGIGINPITNLTNWRIFSLNEKEYPIMLNENSLIIVNIEYFNLNSTNFTKVFTLADIIKECVYDRGYKEFTTDTLAKYYYGSKAYRNKKKSKISYTKITEEQRLEINKCMDVLTSMTVSYVYSTEWKDTTKLYDIHIGSVFLDQDRGNVVFTFNNNYQFYPNFIENKDYSYRLEFTPPLKLIGKGKSKEEELQNFLEQRLISMVKNGNSKIYITIEEITGIYKTNSRKGKIEATEKAKNILIELGKIHNLNMRTHIDNTGRKGATRGIVITFLKK